MRSECLIANVLHKLIKQEKIKRAEIVIATKGGYLPVDLTTQDYSNLSIAEQRLLIKQYFKQHYEQNLGKLTAFELQGILDYRHCIRADFIQQLFTKSLSNLKIKAIDIYYLHNPEVSLNYLSNDQFYQTLFNTFTYLEKQVQLGKLQYYGISTYQGFLQDETHQNYLSLAKIMEVANQVSVNHHFKFIQLPFNLIEQTAAWKINQKINGQQLTILKAAELCNLKVMSNISLAQGKAFDQYSPSEMLEFIIHHPLVSSAMVGTKSKDNMLNNCKLLY